MAFFELRMRQYMIVVFTILGVLLLTVVFTRPMWMKFFFKIDAHLTSDASFDIKQVDNAFGWGMAAVNGAVKSSTKTNTIAHAPVYNASDWDKFVDWKKRASFVGESLPRVLIYTWCTEDTIFTLKNEVYWKSCYAHMHGFDIVFSEAKNFSGLAEYHGNAGESRNWYSDENMWAWWSDVQHYLFSGKYDYVFVMGADVLINRAHLQWPIWAWDRGHDVTIMDQLQFPIYWDYGLNQNDMLFRSSKLSKQFINEAFEFRKGFYIQGDNGPYMETILRFLGRSAESEGRIGYNDKCLPLLVLDAPSFTYLADKTWGNRNYDYSRCFFSELDRMAGGYGFRNTTGIGFYPAFVGSDGKAFYPSNFSEGQRPLLPSGHVHRSLSLGPWANCWSSVLRFWPEPWKNCFAYHWNGPKNPCMHQYIEGGEHADSGRWDAEKNMWAWWSDVQHYLFSGKYDYVFVMAAEVLINLAHLQWPVWAWDRGHDVTVMDQDEFPLHLDFGLNQNDILFRSTNLSKQFITEAFEFRKGFYLQGDNGAYMETILRFLGRWDKSEGGEGYSDECLPLLALEKPSFLYFSDKSWGNRNYNYSKCFFEWLEHMAGYFGDRNTKGIGFYPTVVSLGDRGALLPSDFSGGNTALVPPDHVYYNLMPLGPWANCWSSVRKYWENSSANCFAFHWDGPKSCMPDAIEGRCEDPTFDWDASPYNPANRE